MENQEDIEMETPMEFEAPSQDIDPEAATQAFGDENQSQIDTEAPTQVPEVNDQHSVRSQKKSYYENQRKRQVFRLYNIVSLSN